MLHHYTEELERLYIGQSLDLHWTCNLICPSIEQYLEMIEYSKSSQIVLSRYDTGYRISKLRPVHC